MKKFIYSLIFIIPLLAASQHFEHNNFRFKDQNLNWQQVYNSNLPQEELVKELRKSTAIHKMVYDNNLLTGFIENRLIDYKWFERGLLTIESYITSSVLNFFVSIEFRENRYRVTISNIRLIQPLQTKSNNLGEAYFLKEFVVKNNESGFRDKFKISGSKILNHNFNKLFDLEKQTLDEW